MAAIQLEEPNRRAATQTANEWEMLNVPLENLQFSGQAGQAGYEFP